eukprot:764601-Hanusia_phi.AAC.1
MELRHRAMPPHKRQAHIFQVAHCQDKEARPAGGCTKPQRRSPPLISTSQNDTEWGGLRLHPGDLLKVFYLGAKKEHPEMDADIDKGDSFRSRVGTRTTPGRRTDFTRSTGGEPSQGAGSSMAGAEEWGSKKREKTRDREAVQRKWSMKLATRETGRNLELDFKGDMVTRK